MDPLSVTASVIAVATLAWQSSKAAYGLVDGLVAAPTEIALSKALLSQTQNTLENLTDTLKSGSGQFRVLDSVLQKTKLDGALESTRGVCDEFGKAVQEFTSHSTDARFSKRDRLAVSLCGSKLNRFNQQLGECQSTISLALVSIDLIISSRTSEDIQRLDERFTDQEAALASLEKQLRDKETALQAISLDRLGDGAGELWSAAERAASGRLAARLREVCRETLSATRERRTGQSFGDMRTDGNSRAFQGIVGTAHSGMEQSFGQMTTTGGSTAAQAQMDAASFAVMFWRP